MLAPLPACLLANWTAYSFLQQVLSSTPSSKKTNFFRLRCGSLQSFQRPLDYLTLCFGSLKLFQTLTLVGLYDFVCSLKFSSILSQTRLNHRTNYLLLHFIHHFCPSLALSPLFIFYPLPPFSSPHPPSLATSSAG